MALPDHLPGRRARTEEDAVKINLGNALPLRRLHLDHGSYADDPGVVHHYVEPPMTSDGLGYGIVDGRLIRRIAREDKDKLVLALRGRHLEVEDRDLCTLSKEHPQIPNPMPLAPPGSVATSSSKRAQVAKEPTMVPMLKFTAPSGRLIWRAVLVSQDRSGDEGVSQGDTMRSHLLG